MKFYLIGSNIQGSLSPKIHNAIYGEFGVRAQYSLLDFADISLCLDSAKDANGYNVTTPFKEQILPFLKRDLSGIGSVNTVKNNDGYSTDGEGFILDARRLGLDLSEVLLLGSGGAAKSICHSLRAIGSRVYFHSESGRTLLGAKQACAPFSAKLVVNCSGRDYCTDLFKGERYDLRYQNPQGISGIGTLIYQAILSDEIFLSRRIDLSIFKTILGKL